MSRIFSITERVCTRMSRRVWPSGSASAPAIVLSARRALVPDTNRKSPARFTCGYLPSGAALPSTTLLLLPVILISVFALGDVLEAPALSESYTDIVRFGIEIQRMHSTFTSNARKSRSSEWRSQIAQEPAIHPCNAHLHLLCDTMPALQIAGPDRGGEAVFCVVGHGDGFFLRIKRCDVANGPKYFFLDAPRGFWQSSIDC